VGVEHNRARTYIIDGYNVIRRDTRLRTMEAEQGLEEGRNALVSQIRNSERLAKARIIVVFDGAAGAASRTSSPRSKVDVLFSVPPQNADQKIVSILNSRGEDNSITVVTADRDLQWEVKKLGARVVDPGDFIKSQLAPHKRPRRESSADPITTAEDLAWGLKTFGNGIINIEAAVKNASTPIPAKGRTVDKDKKERNRKRYLRLIERKG
jgi:predicted RNA-binding protein with PIN domain